MSTKQRVSDLIAYVEQGRLIEAMTEFYADDVVMQENLDPPTVGLAANLERERAFYGSLRSIRFRVVSAVIEGDRATVNWVYEAELPDGRRWTVDQLSYQSWRDGRIVRERFYYDTAQLAAA